MTERLGAPPLPNGVVLRHANGQDELAACFPVISLLSPRLKGAEEWVMRASEMVTEGERGNGLGAALLKELSTIGVDEHCQALHLDTAATNTNARHFYAREGLVDAAIGFVKPLGEAA
jgi:GNAT superfamily N-acetyltransferase